MLPSVFTKQQMVAPTRGIGPAPRLCTTPGRDGCPILSWGYTRVRLFPIWMALKCDRWPFSYLGIITHNCPIMLRISQRIGHFRNIKYSAWYWGSEDKNDRNHWSQKKKDWIEQPIVLAPTKLKPAAPSRWDHFRGKAYCMSWKK